MRTALNGSHVSCGDARTHLNVRVRLATSGLSSPNAWINADDSAKDPREVRLIAHPAVEGDL